MGNYLTLSLCLSLRILVVSTLVHNFDVFMLFSIDSKYMAHIYCLSVKLVLLTVQHYNTIVARSIAMSCAAYTALYIIPCQTA